jgi:hypothetical protein
MSNQSRGLSAETIARLLTDTEPYLSCDDCFKQIDQYVERRIADPHYDDPLMKTHLTGCGVCAEEARTLEELLQDDAG